MPRTLTINYCRITRVQFDMAPTNPNPSVTAYYTVGTVTTTNGVTTYIDLPNNGVGTGVTVGITLTATVTQIWQAVLAAIEAQEGLSLTSTPPDTFVPVPQ